MNEKIRKKCKTLNTIAEVGRLLLIVSVIVCMIGIILPNFIFVEGGKIKEYPEILTSVENYILGILEIETNELGNYPKIAFASILSICTLYVIILYMILRRIELIMKEFTNGATPFSSNAVKHIKILSTLLLIYTIVIPFLGAISDVALGIEIFRGISISGLIITIVAALLANIFEYGSELQQEVDETL